MITSACAFAGGRCARRRFARQSVTDVEQPVALAEIPGMQPMACGLERGDEAVQIAPNGEIRLHERGLKPAGAVDQILVVVNPSEQRLDALERREIRRTCGTWRHFGRQLEAVTQ